jgi:hypothetical protein
MVELQSWVSDRIKASSAQIAEFCQRWQIIEFALFGSILRDDFRPDSDIDVLLTFSPDSRWSLFDWVDVNYPTHKGMGLVTNPRGLSHLAD